MLRVREQRECHGPCVNVKQSMGDDATGPNDSSTARKAKRAERSNISLSLTIYCYTDLINLPPNAEKPGLYQSLKGCG